MASMAAARGAAVARPENTARSPMLFSSRNVGRWFTCNEWNSAVVARARFDFGRLCFLEQRRRIQASSSGGDRGGLFPIPDLAPFPQRRVCNGQTRAVVGSAELLRRLGHQVRRQILLQAGFEPAGVEHESRPHDRAAPPVKPIALIAR